MKSERLRSAFRTPRSSVPVALTIAGSDSGGGAGIQADLKTFAALSVFGTSAITCVTAQNPDKVSGIAAIDPDMVSLQIRTVCEGFPVKAAKTGMLYSAPIIRAVAKTIIECAIPALVVDPVMVATSGARLLREDAVEALCSDLVPRAAVITPNVSEAEILCGHSIVSFDELKAAAREIGEKFDVACVVKGGHLGIEDRGRRTEDRGRQKPDGEVVDVLFSDGKLTVFSSSRVDAVETHGTGCAFSAALTAFLARNRQPRDAVRLAKEFVAEALRSAIHTGTHWPLSLG